MTDLVLVVGCARSGTTWLAEMLLAHPATTGAPEAETQLFQSLQDLWANADRADGRGIMTYLDPVTVDRAVRHFCDSLIEAAIRRYAPDAAVFVEKTPGHAFLLRQISRLYPDVRVVHIVRDGRDVARSLSGLDFGTPTVLAGAQTWRRTLEAVAAQAPVLKHFREVRYEDLLADPGGRVGELLEWLGLPVDADVLSRVDAAAARRVSQFDTEGPVGAGKWRSMPRADLDQVYFNVGDVLVSLGYLDADELAVWSRTWRVRTMRMTERVRCAVRSRRRDGSSAGRKTASNV